MIEHLGELKLCYKSYLLAQDLLLLMSYRKVSYAKLRHWCRSQLTQWQTEQLARSPLDSSLITWPWFYWIVICDTRVL